MLYMAKCYWHGVAQADLEQVAERAARAGLALGGSRVSYLGSLLFAADDLVLCLSRAQSRPTVTQASDQLGVLRECLMELLWPGPARRVPEGAQK